MTLVRFDPFRQMQESMGRFLDRPLGAAFGTELPIGAGWTPAVDIREAADALHVTVELPGVDKEDIHVSVENNVLTLTGERKVAQDVKEESFQWRERVYGTFRRSFSLPRTVDRDHIKARYDNGLLQLELPQKPETKPKQITIESAA